MNDIHSLLGAYVVDALDEGELEEFEKHLHDCVPCRDEVAALRETMAGVSSVHEVAPPPALRASILQKISSTPMLPAEDPQPETAVRGETHVGPIAITSTRAVSRRRRPVSTWLAAVAAVLAIALGGVTIWQYEHLQSIEADQAQRIDLLAAPDLQVRHATLAGSDLTYLVSAHRLQAMVTASGLPAPGTDRSWQVWVMQDGVPRSGAVVDRGGQFETWIVGISGAQGFAITNEPRGGSPAPTGDVQAVVEL